MSRRMMMIVAIVALMWVQLVGAGGSVRGHVTDSGRRPYSNYSVQLRATDGTVVGTRQKLLTDGQFDLLANTNQKVLVELVDRDNKVVCTEGPFVVPMADVKVDCGRKSVIAWLLGAAAAVGATSAVAIATRSASQ